MTDMDFVRREARASQVEHGSAMRQIRAIVGRLFGGDGANESAAAKEAFAIGGYNRRGFFKIGGLTVASAAVFAACGSDGDSVATDEDEEADKTEPSDADIAILRTASSIEYLAVEVYRRAIDSGLLTTPAVADAAKLFQEQHGEHAGLFTGATKERGAEPFDKPNPVLLQGLLPALAGLRDEPGAVRLAFDLENVAAATYFSSAGAFKDRKLNQATMSVGGVEARHVAVLAAVLGQPQVPRVFQTPDGAVAPGTGV